MDPQVYNLFQAKDGSGEEIIPLLRKEAFVLEHIISRGASSEPDFWYDQPKAEWVLLISGTATLEFEDRKVTLAGGDSLLIPAHCRHRVSATSLDAHWIALHLDSPDSAT